MTKTVRIGRFSLIFTRKKKSLCLTVLVSKVLRNSFQDDQNIINKVFYVAEKFDKKGNKMTLGTVRFSILEYKKTQKLWQTEQNNYWFVRSDKQIWWKTQDYKWSYRSFNWWWAADSLKRHVWNVSNLILRKSI